MTRKLTSLITAFAIIFISSVVALADSPDDARVSSWLAPDLDSVEAKALAEEVYDKLSDSTRAVHDVNDIYLLLYDDIRPALMGLNSGGNYSLPRIAYYEREIYNAIYGQPSSVTRLDEILDNMLYAMDSRYYTIPQLQAMTWNQLVDLNSTQGTALNRLTSISNQLTVLNSKLDGYNWSAAPFNYFGTSLDFDTNFLSATTSSYKFVVDFHTPPTTNPDPCVYRFLLPIKPNLDHDNNFNVSSIKLYQNGTFIDSYYELNYFLEPTANGTYMYLFDFPYYNDYLYCFEVTSTDSSYQLYYLDHLASSANCVKIDFNTDEYQQLKQAFYQKKSSDSLGSLDKLADVYASDDLIQAKQNQQSVEDGVLTDFTGSGSESMSLSDVGGVKNVSSNAKQFLGTGSSGGNALSVFNVNGQGLWQWFSQTTADNLDSTTPTRGSDGYLSIYDQNMQDYLDGLGGDENAR